MGQPFIAKMNKKNLIFSAAQYVSLVAFILFMVYVLYINQEVFYTVHDRSEFIFGSPFFHTLMSKPFGLMRYVGAWLTQFFYYPALGSGMLVAIWALIFVVGAKAFRLQGAASALMLLPVACLLTSVVDLGYWIYVCPFKGYWFSQSVGYLVMLLLLWVARCTPRKWHIVWYLLGFCIYPVLGWYAMLFVICLALSGKFSWREIAGLALLLFTVGIWHGLLYSNLKFDDVVLAGFPRFIKGLDSSKQLSYPFVVLGVFSVIIPLCGKYLAKWFVPALCALAGILFTSSFMYRDKKYIDEMRMVRYACDEDWKEVLSIVKEYNKPTCTMMFLKNIALMNEGGLLDSSFKTGNIAGRIYSPDLQHVSFLQIVSPLVYYNYGMMNEAIRLSYENGVQEGFSPFILKVLSRCTFATKENELSERFVTLLNHHPFYADWQPAKPTAKVAELQKCYPDELSGTENSDRYVVNSISLWYESDSKVASEQSLFYSMLRCDAFTFWHSLRKYLQKHEGEDFPLHAQEAYILFMDRAPEEKRMMIPVEEDVYNRYKKFGETLVRLMKPGKTIGDVAEAMRSEWEGTYWYYFFFGRQYSTPVERKDNEIAS